MKTRYALNGMLLDGDGMPLEHQEISEQRATFFLDIPTCRPGQHLLNLTCTA